MVRGCVLAAAIVGSLALASAAPAAVVLHYQFYDSNNADNAGANVADLSGNGIACKLEPRTGGLGFADTSAGYGDTHTYGWLSTGGLKFNRTQQTTLTYNQDSAAAFLPAGSNWTYEVITSFDTTFDATYPGQNTAALFSSRGSGWFMIGYRRDIDCIRVRYAGTVAGGGSVDKYYNVLRPASAPRAWDGAAHALAVAYDSTALTLTCYVDGVAYTTLSTGGVALDMTPNRMGAFSFDGGGYQGVVYEARLSNTALTPSQLLSIPEPGAIGVFSLGLLLLSSRSRRLS